MKTPIRGAAPVILDDLWVQNTQFSEQVFDDPKSAKRRIIDLDSDSTNVQHTYTTIFTAHTPYYDNDDERKSMQTEQIKE